MEIKVFESVYEPGEDSYLLLRSVKCSSGELVLDMGCGSGIIAVKAALQGAKVIAVDINKEAVKNTLFNARMNNVKVFAIAGDLFSPLKKSLKFDKIFFNPPYLPEKLDEKDVLSLAWCGGKDGIEIILRFLEELPDFLKENGKCFMVVSTLAKLDKVEKFLEKISMEKRKISEISFFFERLELWEIKHAEKTY